MSKLLGTFFLRKKQFCPIIYREDIMTAKEDFMKKSIQTKIIRLIVTGMLLCAFLIGGVSIYNMNKVAEEESLQIMNLTAEESAGELNDVLGRIEQSVNIMSVYTVRNLESIDRLIHDREYHDAYLMQLADLAENIVEETEGSVAIYVRLNEDISFPTDGFFMVKNAQTGLLESIEPTDLSLYEADDREHVGWYYEPIEAGHAMWMDPYMNKNINVEMISYIIPVYKENELLGVVGMDIEFDYVREIVDSIQVYDTGYAFIANEDFVIAHSKEFESGTTVRGFSDVLASADVDELVSQRELYSCTIDGVERRVAFSELNNGKIMAVIAPMGEIYAAANIHIVQSVLIAFVITVIFIILTMRSAKSMIRPLQELDAAAKEIAQGNLDVSINISSHDEIGTLAESLSETARQLKTRINYINNLAYMDKLTGVKNNTAYMHDVSLLKEGMHRKDVEFSLFVIDVNGLKGINDNYGHDAGNELIIGTTQMISNVFGHENVYRIGGDEFAVLLLDVPTESCEEYKQQFLADIEAQSGDVIIAAAIGSSTYDKKKDISYENVFKRADEEMYASKQQMKREGMTSQWLKKA